MAHFETELSSLNLKKGRVTVAWPKYSFSASIDVIVWNVKRLVLITPLSNPGGG